ncbi:MAG: glycosyltransferase family 2 protein [Candidatus Gastranaerophilales bacterium]|nr:glycosyltransferase family 2 protein [Candidatus Gastranaerophilales bacterium]
MNPEITVLMPVYNSEKYLKESIESILNQTFKDFEFLILNDGSTDQSVNIIESYSDSRIRLIHNEQNLGLISTLNRGIDLSQGKYIARMDSDDISFPERLEKQFKLMEEKKDIGICGTLFQVFGKHNYIPNHPENTELIKAYLIFGCYIGHPTIMIRKSILEQHDLKYDDNFKHAEDYELWTRVIKYSKFTNIQEILLHYRSHDSQICQKFTQIQSQNLRKIHFNYLKNLGFEPSENEIGIHNAVIEQRYKDDISFKEKARILYNKIIDANKKTGFFDEKALDFTIKSLFYNPYNYN